MESDIGPDRREIHFSAEMIRWHCQNLTLPPELVRQCNAIRNHGCAEGWTRVQ